MNASQLNHNAFFLRTADVACGRSLQPVIEPKRLSRKMEKKKVAGLCMVRDSVDIVPFLCGHYLRMGVDHIHFVDDGSTDGTYDLLRALARRTGKIQVSRLVNTEVVQRATVENMANELVDRGFRFILPFDADEFWNISPRQLAGLGQSRDDHVITGRWVNFVQRRSTTYPVPFGIYGAVHRFVPTLTATFEEVVGKTKPWLAVSLDKIAFASRSPVTMLLGQHALVDGPPTRPEPYEIFHLPLRSRTEIEKRGLNYEPRRTAIRHDPDESWQSAFHREIVMSDDVDAAWAANSADRFGRADVFGRPAQLVRDTRLRTVLASAAAYLLFRYGWLTL